MTVGRRAPREDRVTPETRAYVFARDEYRCIVDRLVELGKIVRRGPCRDQYGSEVVVWRSGESFVRTTLTAAHVRDRGRGGRMSKRPASTARRLVTACVGHHLADPAVDRPEVRDAIDEYLEAKEGRDQDADARPWETVRRVRSPDDRVSEPRGLPQESRAGLGVGRMDNTGRAIDGASVSADPQRSVVDVTNVSRTGSSDGT